ncbi:MAG: hypothetical protein HY791_14640 [Deltaproteobacteria bacterium]|nr:hypothetical protein [Deltaproteobacteria bacterium]
MDPAVGLLFAIACLHVVEGVFWVRRGALGFRKNRLVRQTEWLGNHKGNFMLLSPVPGLDNIHVVEPWPIFVSADGVVLTRVENFSTLADPGTGKLIPFSELERARADGKKLILGAHECRTSSPMLSWTLSRRLRRLAKLSSAERPAELAKWLAEGHDLDGARSRLLALASATRSLAVLGPATFAILLGGAYAVFFVPVAATQWPWVLGALVTTATITGIEAYRAHRKLYPELSDDRFVKTALIFLSPVSAARARAFLSRDALATFHPLTAAAALLGKDKLQAFAAEVWRDVEFPVSSEISGVQEARAELRARHRSLLEALGLDSATLTRAPERESDRAVAYCPRCLGQYHAPGECGECPGVRLVSF